MSGEGWRLLRTPPAAGARNMAVDEAILRAVAAGAAPPTLRFYGWRPPCLSLGCFQRLEEIDRAACAARGIDVVRRPTGGSAILHDRELTYSLSAPEGEPRLRGGIPGSYHAIAGALAQALRQVGVPAELAPERTDASGRQQPGGAGRPAPCFVRPAGFEILANGRKLVGSAQMRSAGALLQHGAIPLDGDIAAITALLNQPAAARASLVDRLRGSATTARQAAGAPVSADGLAGAIAAALAALWGIILSPGELTAAEERQAQELEAGKYANESWTSRAPGRGGPEQAAGAPEVGDR